MRTGYFRLPPNYNNRLVKSLGGLDVHQIQFLDKPELLKLQRSLGYGGEWGVWRTPPEWIVPSDRIRSNLIKRLDPSTAEFDRVWTEILRLALVCSLPFVRERPYAPGTVARRVDYAIRLAPEMLATKPKGLGWWSRLRERDHDSVTRQQFFATVRGRYKRGLLADCPLSRAMDVGGEERDRKGEKAPTNKVDDSRQFQPLPDEFVAECGFRASWIIKNLGPTLLACFETVSAVQQPRYSGDDRVRRNVLNLARTKIIKNWEWRFPDGTRIEELPFPAVLKSIGFRERHPFSWPIKNWSELKKFLRILQDCHAWVASLSSGPRVSTLLSYEYDCLVDTPAGPRLKGVLFKTPDEKGGRQQDWPLPALVVQALRQQVFLAKRVRRLPSSSRTRDQGRHIWLSFGVGKKPPGGTLTGTSMCIGLDNLVDVFDLRHLLDEDNPRVHTHRFRKTLARIVALAMTNGLMVLMDCFGHDDPEMTLGYMISDKAVLGDVRRVQRELVILMAKDAIADSDTIGGHAGEMIRRVKAAYLRVHQKSALDPEDMYELAESLTVGGRTWAVVMPGVICTLPIGYTGPCALKQGRRNPSNCQSGCDHQLLTALSKTQCDDTVEWTLAQLTIADTKGSADISMWQGQLWNWLYRWPDVYDKWSNHPLVIKYGDPSLTREQILDERA